MESYTIRKLTPNNVEALKLARGEYPPKEGETLLITATTATFTMEDPYEWVVQAREVLATGYGKPGHPHQSFHSVVRKVKNAMQAGEAKANPLPENAASPMEAAPKALADLMKLD